MAVLSLTPQQSAFGASEAEWMCFDDHPEWFVDVSHTPVVFSVRGIAFFSPQFRRFGVSISDVKTPEQFSEASMQASILQMQDLAIRINKIASTTYGASEHKLLNAVLHGTKEDISREARRLKHKQTAGLQAVDTATSAVTLTR